MKVLAIVDSVVARYTSESRQIFKSYRADDVHSPRIAFLSTMDIPHQPEVNRIAHAVRLENDE